MKRVCDVLISCMPPSVRKLRNESPGRKHIGYHGLDFGRGSMMRTLSLQFLVFELLKAVEEHH